MAAEENRSPRSQRPPGHLEQEETRLWRLALLFMVLLAVALAVLVWERLQSIPYHLGAIAPGLLILSVLFAAYAYGRRREVSELQVLLKDLQDRVGVTPSEDQLDQLSQVILRSQRNFKELIDSFDDPACAVSLDGTLRTVASYHPDPRQRELEQKLDLLIPPRQWDAGPAAQKLSLTRF